MLSKKNKIIAGTVAAVLVVAGGTFAIVKANASDLKLKEEAVEVEYGKAVSTKAEDYLDLSKVEDKEAYLKDVTVTKDTKLEKGKKYEALGDYEVVIKDKEDEATVKVTVKDTTKPKFNKVDKIETFKGEKVNYKKFVKAKDLQKVTLSFDDKEVKLSKTGNYLLKVTATDASDNKAEKEIKVVVKDKPKLNPGDKVTTVVDKNGNVTTKVDRYVAPKKSYSSNSSNSSSNKGYSSSSSNRKPSKKPSKPIKKPSNKDPEWHYGGEIEGTNNTWYETDWYPSGN